MQDDHEPPHDRSNGVASRDVDPSSVPVAITRSNLDFGVVVGVEHYPHFRSAPGAIRDAQAFYDWLCDPDGGGVDPRNAKLVQSNLEARTPVQDEIDQMLVEV